MPFSSDDITVLDWREAVRQRPAMYLGGLGQDGLNCMVAEVIGNAVGEVTEGHASRVCVELGDDALSVEDDGRGIPITVGELGKSALEVVFTTLHAGCNCGCDEPPGHREGDHGVGLAVINALSAWLEVETVRDGTLYRMGFAQGRITRELENCGSTARQGTRVSFGPDRSIFGESPLFDTPWLREHLEEIRRRHQAQIALTQA